ncbi:MAG: HYR domain-containing protein, partial [Saprospiraceae bacterium]
MQRILLIIILIAGVIRLASAQSAVLSINDVSGSENVQLDIIANEIVDVTSLEITVSWDPTELTPVETYSTFPANGNLPIPPPNLLSEFGSATVGTDINIGELGFIWFDLTGGSATLAQPNQVVFSIIFKAANGPGSFNVDLIPDAFSANGQITDLNGGNNDSATITFTTNCDNDTTSPTIECPDDITRQADANGTIIINDLPEPTSSDLCGSTTITEVTGVPANNEFSVGSTEIMYTVRDESNNENSCSYNVVVTAPDNTGGTDRLTFSASTQTVACGTDPIFVNITTDNFTDLTGAQFSVIWDTDVIQLDEISNQNATLRSRNFPPNTDFVENESGKVEMLWFSNGSVPVTLNSDNNVLFTLKFFSTGVGTSTQIDIVEQGAAVANANGEEVPPSEIDYVDGLITFDRSDDNAPPSFGDTCPTDILIEVEAG